MKKILILALAATFVFAGSALAGTINEGLTVKGGASGSESTMIGKLSKGVSMGFLTSATAYALTTFHENGSQMYGTAHDSTSLYRKSATALAAPSTSDSSAFADFDAF